MKLENLYKKYNTKNREIEALKDINYEFLDNKFYAIKGHSGSGKSTLIRIMGLLDKPTSGKYIIANEDISKLTSDELAYLRMKHIGFVYQDFNLDEHLTAIENVILPMLINKEIKREDREKIAKNLLAKLGIKERLNHYPHELSGGEQQRVAMARALANNPKIILADEPTGNLDEDNEKMVFMELKKLSQEGKCVVVVSHSNEIDEYADIIININKGKID